MIWSFKRIPILDFFILPHSNVIDFNRNAVLDNKFVYYHTYYSWGGLMTIVRLGYVAMSMELNNASPSQTMTFTQFQKIKDRKRPYEN